MPFGKYKDFNACVREQIGKGFSEDRAKRICATIHKKITGKWPTELSEQCECVKCGNKINKISGYPCEDYLCPECGGNLK